MGSDAGNVRAVPGDDHGEPDDDSQLDDIPQAARFAVAWMAAISSHVVYLPAGLVGPGILMPDKKIEDVDDRG
jgi:hypothetical protein